MIQLNEIGRDAMLATGAHAATDITGFGLAGHALEMAEGGNVTLIFELSRLPLLPGADNLAQKLYFTRARATNVSYVSSSLRLEGPSDGVRQEFLYDPQTSGGLLISVPAAQADKLVDMAKAKGANATTVIGEVIERADVSLIARG